MEVRGGRQEVYFLLLHLAILVALVDIETHVGVQVRYYPGVDLILACHFLLLRFLRRRFLQHLDYTAMPLGNLQIVRREDCLPDPAVAHEIHHCFRSPRVGRRCPGCRYQERNGLSSQLLPPKGVQLGGSGTACPAAFQLVFRTLGQGRNMRISHGYLRCREPWLLVSQGLSNCLLQLLLLLCVLRLGHRLGTSLQNFERLLPLVQDDRTHPRVRGVVFWKR